MDDYKISLEILYRLLKDEGEEHWANWIQKDINFWTTEKSVAHHLRAYGGMGSINDLLVGDSDDIGIWKNNLFEAAKTLSWSLAKGEVTTAPLDESFYRYGTSQISGWCCKSCGHARLSKTNIERYLAAEFLPKFFIDYIKQNKLIEILHLENIISDEKIVAQRNAIEKLVQEANIELSVENNWLQVCPQCSSDDICAYRWQIVANYSKLIAADDNV